MRLFVAIVPSLEVRRALGETTDLLRRAGGDVKWVEPENVHLTLKFLGNVDEPRVPALEAALRQAAGSCAPFELEVGDVGAFPPRGRPRVIWMGCTSADPANPLLALQRAVEGAVDALGFPPEERSFAGHFTLGRVRSPRGLERLAASLKEVRERRAGRLAVRQIALIESRLASQGPTYLTIAELPLRG